MIVAICAILMVVLFVLKFPIYVSILIPSVVYFSYSDVSMLMIPQQMITAVESVPIMAIPFFILASATMNYTGIADKIYALANTLVGHLYGGLAQVNILVSAMMGGLSGSNLADAAMDAKMLVPQMTKQGYPKGFSAAVTGSSALITPIIPPGLPLIMFAFIANVSVGRMFMAGLLPGILMTIMQMVIVARVSKVRKFMPIREKRASVKEVAANAKDGVLALVLPIIIIGGIRFGIFTATEAGAFAVVYSVVLGTLVYKQFKGRHMKMALIETVTSTASVMLIIASAKCFAYFISNEQITQHLVGFFTRYVHSGWQFLLIINVILLIGGMFMEGNALMILLIPLCMPIIAQYNIDPIHFGIIFCLNISIGTITPPVGTVMYLTCQIVGCSVKEFVMEGLPMYVALLLSLVVVTFLPQLTIWLPNLIYGIAA